jgi:phosphomannomutase
MTPIKFGTDGWRAIIAQDYTMDNLRRVTEALRRWLFEQTMATPEVMLGYDCRFGGPMFARAVANQLAQEGVRVFLGPDFVSTPMVSLATCQRQCNAGVVLTASHNPPEYNGFKIKGPYGGPAYQRTIADIESRIPDAAPTAYPDRFEECFETGWIEYYDMEALYINNIKATFDWDAIHQAGFKLGYDAMYGAGQHAMRRLFPQASFLHCDYNPSFKGQAPEPIDKNLQALKQAICEQGLDFGLANDGDADRIGLYDENANFIDSHHIILLLIHYLHKTKGMRGKVVVTFSCTSKIQQLCQQYGLEVQVTKIGFKYIGEIMAQEDVLVGGEESGGIAVAGHVPERDGIYIALVLLEMMAQHGQQLSELIEALYSIVGRFAMRRHDLHLPEEQKQRVMQQCQSAPYEQIGRSPVQHVEDLDGYKFHLPGGEWVMIRPSGTEPVLRVYAEGQDPERAQAIIDQALATIEKT